MHYDYFCKCKRPLSQIQWNEKEDVYSDFKGKGAQFPKMFILLGAMASINLRDFPGKKCPMV